MTIRVLVVDDNQLLRAGLVTILSSAPDLDVVGEAADGAAAVEVAAATTPDVVLMDVEMPGGDGITATRALAERLPGARVLILTMFDLDDYVAEALRAGAAGFLLKTTEPAALIESVRTCAAGQAVVGASVMRRLVDSYVSRTDAVQVPGLTSLTARETDVLRAMAKGLSNAEIGAELYLAETTVKTHVARILLKLGVRDRLQAAVLAHRAGIAQA